MRAHGERDQIDHEAADLPSSQTTEQCRPGTESPLPRDLRGNDDERGRAAFPSRRTREL